ncbi:MAG: hypothetical protein LBU89_12585 [Fibromonadaceae bacterium]|nr:hypothetical protein [Fibromonadaceae bacterium]
MIFFAIFFSVIALPVFGQQMFNSCVENETANCSVMLPTTFTTANAALPDPFTKLDGARMSTKEEWGCRRQEILRLAERTIYGTKPPKPTSVTGTVTNSQITVNVSEDGKNASFTATVLLPTTGTAPYPAVIRFGSSGADAATLRNWGVAVINFDNTSVGSENGSRTNKTGAFYTIYGSNSKAGLLVAWAWGVSRIIDVIEQSGSAIIKPDAIGVTGCSRLGKGAFAAGVFDQRVALTIPMESGTGGTNIMRGAFADRDQSGGTNGAQSPSSAYGETYWLGDDFSAFTSNPNNLPIDIHQAIALVAPRGFFVMDKTASSAGQWLNIPSSHRAALAAAEVYKALGVGGNFHYMNTPTQFHCSGQSSYDTQLRDFVDKFLHKTKSVGTTPLFTATAAPSMTAWVNWTTPELTGNLTIGGCNSTPSSSSSTTPSSSSSEGPSVDCDYQPSFCGGAAFASVLHNSTAMPAEGECLFIGGFEEIQPNLNSAISINGLENICGSDWDNCTYNIKPDAIDGGYYVYVERGEVNPYQNNGWQNIVAGTKLNCNTSTTATLPTSHLPLATSHSSLYYNLKGEPLGTAKPTASGVYIVRNPKTGQTQKMVVK